MSKPEPMRAIIVLLSYTGKSGKSTMTNNLFEPRMLNPTIFRIETINESGQMSNVNMEVKLKGREIEKLMTSLSKTDCAIIDVGSSNIESFLLTLAQQSESHRIFTYFIVPVEANGSKINEFIEAAKTITVLNKLGIGSSRIKVVFNKLEPDNLVEEEMSRFINFHKKNPIFTLNTHAVIYQTQAFKAISESKLSYQQLVADKTDYFNLLNLTSLDKPDERTRIVKMARAQGLVKQLDADLDHVFDVLFGDADFSNLDKASSEFDEFIFN